MTVKRLLKEIDSKELSEWMAFYNIEPFGEFRADIRSAIIACTLANCNRGKNQSAFKISDFMPKFETETKNQSPEEMKKLLQAFCGQMKKVNK